VIFGSEAWRFDTPRAIPPYERHRVLLTRSSRMRVTL